MVTQATLNVLGTNGLHHTPAGGSSSGYKPPATIQLADKDLITIRKKPFRFEYGPGPEPQVPFSPAPKSSDYSQGASSPVKRIPGSPAQGLRRRASHRLSLVPEGRTFVPLSPVKNRRHSTLGLGNMRTPIKTNSRSKLSKEIPNEQEEEESEEPVVDIANGEEGDKVYLETTEEDQAEEEETVQSKPISENPFLPPQEDQDAQASEVEVAVEITPSTPPKTPRSVPLPAAVDTPYDASVTPAPQNKPGTPVPAKIALSTPKGPATLRKALLLRSARKVWQESREAGVEGAIQNGNVETRRKSLSPITRSGRKSVTPVPNLPVDLEEDDEEDQAESDEASGPGDQVAASSPHQSVYEDGTAEASFESSSSGGDSLEADMSLDIPGKGMINFSSSVPEDEEEHINENHGLEHGDEDEDMGSEEDAQEQLEYEDHEEALKGSDEEAASYEEDVDEAEKEESGDEAMSLPGTPQTQRTIPNQFFTPQPVRGSYAHGRRSLGGVGGAPVRLGTIPSTPSSARPTRTPGSLGKPSRGVWTTASTTALNVDSEEVDDAKPKKPSTPARAAASVEEMKRRRETLATPRTLPAPPATGFKNLVRETHFADLLATPGHRALAAQSPSPEPEEPGQGDGVSRAVPATPIDDLKKRLNKMRSQSAQRNERRATVGFAIPSTPSQPIFGAAGSHSVNPGRIIGKGPQTPIFPKLNRDNVPSASDAAPHGVVPKAAISPARPQEPSSPIYEPPSSPSTLMYTGLKEMLKAPQPAKTPNMAGIRTLFPATPKETATPSFAGVKEMLRQPTVAVTPSFTGVREMFKHKPEPPTPIMEGLYEMYEEFEEDEEVELNQTAEEEDEEMNQTEDEIVVAFNSFEADNQKAVLCSVAEDTQVDQAAEAEISANASDKPLEEEDEEEEEVEEIENRSEQSTVVVPTKRSSPPRTKASSSTRPGASSTVSSRANRATVAETSLPATTAATVIKATTSRLPTRRPAASDVPVKTAQAPSKPSRSRKAAEPVVSAQHGTTSRPSRTTRATSIASTNDGESISSRAATTSRSRSTRAKSTAEPEDVPQIAPEPVKVTARSRSTSSRTIKKTDDEDSKPSRGKKPLTQIEEQVKGDSAPILVEEKKSTSSRAKKTTAAAPATTATAASKRSTTTKASAGEEKVSAPSRTKAATRATASATAVKGKENDETQVDGNDRKSTSAASKRRVASKAAVVEDTKSAAAVPVARATRSRK
ncbi:hypothetical protein I316_01920 [Kwoniella heveanensis BCC8398]|uniref:PP1-binding domain-containing protein n=1 Tax=Kwoniella heveanensis BCC8398 TaxID=1296120 RepID=A0A1B9GYD0_9TREE|nr:hypothetical protein I316_01920 [Kwoniella heveanensis BCC8398]